jgi:hypothetical protein
VDSLGKRERTRADAAMNRCGRSCRSWRERSSVGLLMRAWTLATKRRRSESQTSTTLVSGARAEHPEKKALTLRADRTAATSLHRGEPGVALDFVHEICGKWASDPGAERGGPLHTGMPGAGSGYEFRESASVAGGGATRCGTRSAAGNSLGPECTYRHFLAWCVTKKIGVVQIQPCDRCRTDERRVFSGGCGRTLHK